MKILFDNKELNVKYCQNFKDRLIGLMFNKNNIDYCLCFPNCNSIHTFFMKQNIDVVMTDKDNKILFLYKSLKPWKIIWPKKNVYYVYETKENTFNYNIGDFLNIKK